jgi:hypothetical protein
MFLPKKTGRLGLETITWWKVPKTIRHLQRPRVPPMLLHPRAPRLRHLAQSHRHRQLAPRALAAAVALIQAEARLRMHHQRLPHLRLRLTPRRLPPAEEVEAAARTEIFFISEILKEKRLHSSEPFFFSRNITSNMQLAHC